LLGHSTFSTLSFSNNYNTGTIRCITNTASAPNAANYAGGIAGIASNTSSFTNNYNSGDIIIESTFSSYYGYAGGIVGSIDTSSGGSITIEYNVALSGTITVPSYPQAYSAWIVSHAFPATAITQNYSEDSPLLNADTSVTGFSSEPDGMTDYLFGVGSAPYIAPPLLWDFTNIWCWDGSGSNAVPRLRWQQSMFGQCL
jgi:hypothetical protein